MMFRKNSCTKLISLVEIQNTRSKHLNEINPRAGNINMLQWKKSILIDPSFLFNHISILDVYSSLIAFYSNPIWKQLHKGSSSSMSNLFWIIKVNIILSWFDALDNMTITKRNTMIKTPESVFWGPRLSECGV